MTTERHDRVSELFAAVCDLQPEERRVFLERETHGDSALLAEVEALVATDRGSGDFMHTPALGDSFKVEETESAQLGPDAMLVGEVIGKYHLIRMLATGGMGTVYEAQQDEPQRTVAIKVMRQSLSGGSGLRRFRYESQVLARLRHPGIAQVYETGTHQKGTSLPYFVMEYVPDAQPITTFADSRNLGMDARIELFIRVCEAVHHGHQKGVIHRDLKPANILVDPEGQPKIIDFGVARATDSDVAVTRQTDLGQLIGTLQYMSPEQCVADPHDIDTRSDVYALGIVLFELLCDQLPYDVAHASVMQALKVIQEAVPAKPSTINRSLRGDLETISLKALEKERDRRYASAAELSADLQRHLDHNPIEARPSSTVYQLTRFAQRNRGVAAAMAGLVLVIIAGIITTSWQAMRAEDAKDDAITAQHAAEDAEEEAVAAHAHADTEKARAVAVYEYMHEMLTGGMTGERAYTAVEMRNLTVEQLIDLAAAELDDAFPDQPLARADVYSMIQNMYHHLAQYEKALHHGRKAAELFEQELDEDDPDALHPWTSVHADLMALHRYGEAAALSLDMYERQKQLFGEDDEYALVSLNNYGLALWRLHHLDDAEKVLRDVVEGRRSTGGGGFEGMLITRNNLALVLEEQGHAEEAETIFREALEYWRTTYGPQDRTTLGPISNLAYNLRTLGHFDESIELWRELVELHLGFNGEEHPDTLSAMNQLVVTFHLTERFEEAEPVARRVLGLRRTHFGDEDPGTIVGIFNLAWQCWKQGSLEEANQLFKESIALNSRIHSEPHGNTLHARSIYGEFLVEQGRPVEAETQYRAAYDARMGHLGPDNADTVASQVLLGMVLLELDRHHEAEALLRAALSFRRDHFGEEHWLTSYSMSLLGGALLGQNELEEAEPYLLEAARHLVDDEHAPPIRQQEAVGRLISLYDQSGEPDVAAEWRDKVEAMVDSTGE